MFLLGKSTDDYSHLWMVRERRRFKDLCQHDISGTVLKGYRGYPPLEHYLIGLFPEKYWSLTGRLLNILYDCLSVILVFISSYFVFRDYWIISEQPLFIAFITSMMFSTSPILFPPTARLRALGSRTLGGFFFNLFLVSYAGGHIYANYWLYLLSLVSIICILLSSQFATQSIIWMCLFLSIINMDLFPLILLSAALLIFLLPIFDGKKLIYRKFAHYRWYIKYLRKNKGDYFGVQARNRLKDVILLPLNLIKDPRKAYFTLFYQNSFLIAFYSLPIIFIFFYYYIANYNLVNINTDWLYSFGLQLIAASIAIFILTSFRPLLFLGQAERYFEYFLFPLTLISVYLVSRHASDPLATYFLLFIINLSIICFVFLGTHLDGILKNVMYKEDKSFLEVGEFLKTIERPIIMTLPTKLAFKISLYTKEKGKFYYDNICSREKGIDYMLDEHAKLHYFIPDFEMFNRRYGINTFVFSIKELKAAEEQGIYYKLDNLREVFRNMDYLVAKYPL